MKIGSIRHKGLSRFYERGDASGLPQIYVLKIQDMLSFLGIARNVEELHAAPKWRLHPLGGDRKGYWAMRVSANWRLTFRIGAVADEISELDLEDYH